MKAMLRFCDGSIKALLKLYDGSIKALLVYSGSIKAQVSYAGVGEEAGRPIPPQPIIKALLRLC